MPHRIAAVYEQGMLRPLMPLDLREHQQVQVQILAEEAGETAEQVLERLICAGRVSPPRRPEEAAPLSWAERADLARLLGEGLAVPLSQVILDERGEG
jgi:predicted DNA-binding antitoxin AbrB/MazE fold protein